MTRNGRTARRRTALILLLLICLFTLSGCARLIIYGIALGISGIVALVSEGCPHGCRCDTGTVAIGGGVTLCVLLVIVGVPLLIRHLNHRAIGIEPETDDLDVSETLPPLERHEQLSDVLFNQPAATPPAEPAGWSEPTSSWEDDIKKELGQPSVVAQEALDDYQSSKLHVLLGIANSDGEINGEELVAINENCHWPDGGSVGTTDQDWDAALDWLAANATPEQIAGVINSAIAVAAVDGALEPGELQRLTDLSDALGLPQDKLMDVIRSVIG